MGNYGKSTINGGFSSTPSLTTGGSQLPAGDLPEPYTGPSVRCQPQHAGFLSPENQGMTRAVTNWDAHPGKCMPYSNST